MSESQSRKQRRERQTEELERSQHALRESIAHTRILLDQSETLLQRHRRDGDEAGT